MSSGSRSDDEKLSQQKSWRGRGRKSREEQQIHSAPQSEPEREPERERGTG